MPPLSMGPAFFTPAAASGDPLWANVVLYLAGDSTTDLSSYGHVASIGAGVTLDGSPSSSNCGVGSTSIRTNASAAANWTYGTPAPEWRFKTEYTLEWWMYFDTLPGNWVFLSATDFSRFWQVNGGINFNVQGKWGALSLPGSLFSTGSWHQFVEVSDGVNLAAFVDGANVATNGFGQIADSADKSFEVTDQLASNPDYRFMQMRYTSGPGSARYNPLALTIPMQTAPWPIGP